jgi:hypothetical protein
MEAFMRGFLEGEVEYSILGRTNRTGLGKFAHVIERVGLAMAGASGGLFVAAGVNHASIKILQSLGAVFVMIIIGLVGFYLGIDVPTAPTQTIERELVSINTTSKIDPVEVLSAAGTFLASSAALVSVVIIVFDLDLQTSWALVVGFSWLAGATMQIFAGAFARCRGLNFVSGESARHERHERQQAQTPQGHN